MSPPNKPEHVAVDGIMWSRPKLVRFKQRYSEAVEKGVPVFFFEDKGYLVEYAKYLIEFLEDRFSS